MSLTTHYDGSTEKVQYKNGKKEGQELMAAPDGKIETVVTYENGEMTNAEEYEGEPIEEQKSQPAQKGQGGQPGGQSAKTGAVVKPKAEKA